MTNNIIQEFEFRGYNCVITKDEYGYWGIAEKDGYIIEHMFPETFLDEEVMEIKRSIDEAIDGCGYDDGTCQVCGGCPTCGAYCRTSCTCGLDYMNYEDNLDDLDADEIFGQ